MSLRKNGRRVNRKHENRPWTRSPACEFTGGGEGSRTPDTGFFSPLLYPTELPNRMRAEIAIANSLRASKNFSRKLSGAPWPHVLDPSLSGTPPRTPRRSGATPRPRGARTPGATGQPTETPRPAAKAPRRAHRARRPSSQVPARARGQPDDGSCSPRAPPRRRPRPGAFPPRPPPYAPARHRAHARDARCRSSAAPANPAIACPQRGVYHLYAAANAQHGKVLLDGRVEKRRLHPVARGAGLANDRCGLGRQPTVDLRRHVMPPR